MVHANVGSPQSDESADSIINRSAGGSSDDEDYVESKLMSPPSSPRGEDEANFDLSQQVQIMVALASAYARTIAWQGGKELLGKEVLRAKRKLKTDHSIDFAIPSSLKVDKTLALSSQGALTENKGDHLSRLTNVRSVTDREEMLQRDSLEKEGDDAMYTIRHQPTNVNGEMRGYQVEGLNWMYQLYRCGAGGILADEMGLGKTLQTISLLGHNKLHAVEPIPSLIIVPRTTLENWENEFARWCPSLTVVKFWGDKAQRDALWSVCINGTRDHTFYEKYAEQARVDMTEIQARAHQEIAEMLPKWSRTFQVGKSKQKPFDVLLTSFEMVMCESTRIKKLNYDCVIMDEAHRMKNEQSLLSVEVRGLRSNFRLLVTGTPLQNSLSELWSLLNFLMPDIFDSSESLISLFNPETYNDTGDESVDKGLQALHSVLRPFMLRRLKADVVSELPKKRELYVMLPMSQLQRNVYCGLLTRNCNVLKLSTTKDVTTSKLLNVLMELRKTCNHPYLFDGVEAKDHGVESLEDNKVPLSTDMGLVLASSKMKFLHKFLPKLKAKGSRVLLFSQMTRMLDIIDDYLYWQGYTYLRIDGQTDPRLRQSKIDEFNDPDSKHFIFILSTRAGGLGINLATADTVILFDSDFNPQMDLQAQDRAHRLGQKKLVTVYRFITENTVEQKIVERAAKKLQMDSLIVQRGVTVNSKANSRNGDELKSMILFGATEVFKANEDREAEMTDADVDALLDHAEKDNESREVRMKKVEEEFNLKDMRMDGGLAMGAERDGMQAQAKALEDEALVQLEVIAMSQAEIDKLDRRQRRAVLSNVGEVVEDKKRVPRPKLQGWRALANGGHIHQLYTGRLIEELDTLDGVISSLEDKEKIHEEVEAHRTALDRRRELVGEGFSNWTKAEFERLKKGLHTWKPSSVDKLADIVSTKSEVEVSLYLEAVQECDEDVPGWQRAMDHNASVHELIDARLQERKNVLKLMSSILKETASLKDDDPDQIEYNTHEDAIRKIRDTVFGSMSPSVLKTWQRSLYNTSKEPLIGYLQGYEIIGADGNTILDKDHVEDSMQHLDCALLYILYYAVRFANRLETCPSGPGDALTPRMMSPNPSPGRQWVKGVGWVRDGQVGYCARFATSKYPVAEVQRPNVPDGHVFRETIASVDSAVLQKLASRVNLLGDTSSREPWLQNLRLDWEEELLPRLEKLIEILFKKSKVTRAAKKIKTVDDATTSNPKALDKVKTAKAKQAAKKRLKLEEIRLPVKKKSKINESEVKVKKEIKPAKWVSPRRREQS
eukprot:GHVH01011845.1.p1 GENE.GHVH01011845.1~~GHVH01011845.1.p1  ORF type:complete len:1287 (+),score=255.32 GHVH01011845.1:78-3938(+)